MAAPSLAGQVVSGPLSFDVPEDYLCMHTDLDAEKLDSTLVKLSQTVAKNAKVTNGMKDEIGALRAHIDGSVAKLQRSLSVLDDTARALKEQLLRTHDEVKAVRSTAVKRNEYEVDKDLLWRETHVFKGFIEDYNATEGHIDRVHKWVRDFLPVWFADVSGGLLVSFEHKLADSSAATRETIGEDLRRIGHTIQTETKNAVAVLDSRCSSLEDRQVSSDGRVGEMNAKLTRTQQTIAGLTASLEELRNVEREQLEEIKAAENRAAHRTDALAAALGMSTADVSRLYAELPQGTDESTGDDDAAAAKKADAAAKFLAGLPPFRALASSAVDSAREYTESRCNRLWGDTSTQLGEMRRDVADKVGIARLKELLEKNRDEKLHRAVESLTRDMGNMKESKVDATRFAAAMDTKANRDAVDSKAERTFVEHVKDHVLAQTEALNAQVATLQAEVSKVSDMAQSQQQSFGGYPAGGGSHNTSTTAGGLAGGGGGGGGTMHAASQNASTVDSSFRNPAAMAGRPTPPAAASAQSQQQPQGASAFHMSRTSAVAESPAKPAPAATPGTSAGRAADTGGLYDATIGPQARVDGTAHSARQQPSHITPAAQQRPPGTAPAGQSRAYKPGTVTAGAIPQDHPSGAPSANTPRAGASAAAASDQPAVNQVVTPRSNRGRRGSARGRGRASGPADNWGAPPGPTLGGPYEAPPGDDGDGGDAGPARRGLGGLGNVLHRMSAEEYQFERRNDARLLSSGDGAAS